MVILVRIHIGYKKDIGGCGGMGATFEELTVLEQIEFINSELMKDKNISVNRLCDKFGFKRSTIKTRFLKVGYEFNAESRQYEKVDTTEDIKEIQYPNDSQEVSSNAVEEVATTTIESDLNIEDIKELLQYKDKIIELCKSLESSQKVSSEVSNEYMICSEIISTKIINRNFKLYEKVNKELKELLKEYPQYRLQDIINNAVHQYYLNYKK